MFLLFRFFLVDFGVVSIHVAQINNLDSKLTLQTFKQIDLAENVRAFFHTFNFLALPDGSAQVAHLFGDGFFDLLH